MRSKRAKACAISKKTKLRVYERDGGLCIFCHRKGLPEAHIVPRSHGGLGIEQNIVTACRPCHDRLDNSTDRQDMLRTAAAYLSQIYEGWNTKDLVYDKWHKDRVWTSQNDTKTSKMADLKCTFAEKPQKDKANKPPEGFYFLED